MSLFNGSCLQSSLNIEDRVRCHLQPSEGCHVCAEEELFFFDLFSALPRASSDCGPWSKGGTLCVCPACFIVQKHTDEFWREEAASIYKNYNLYHQSSSQEEQPVFDAVTGVAKPRSVQLLETLKKELSFFPLQGAALDIGCGTGAFLKAFSSVFEKGWSLYGFEPNVRSLEELTKIKSVRHVFQETLESIQERFELVSLIHSLEHIENPVALLKQVAQLLAPSGMVLIQVPYFEDNPFDLIIADHCTHFTPDTLRRTVERAGMQVLFLSTEIIPKELTLIASTSHPLQQTRHLSSVSPESMPIETLLEVVSENINWLNEVFSQAKSFSEFGVFGTSIAANWLVSAFKENIKFFVDEDQTRKGTYHGKPVYHPLEIPNDELTPILIPLSPAIAPTIFKRYASKIRNPLHLPPSL